MPKRTLEEVILKLFDCDAVKFGNFTLKSGIQSPVYLDLRVIISFPDLLEDISELMWEKVSEDLSYSSICGVPYTALPIASVLSVKKKIPMIIRRKEMKDYGTKKILEGIIKENDGCLVFEDVIVSGSSVIETLEVLRQHKLEVSEAIVFVDREQGGVKNLTQWDVTVKSVTTIREIIDILQLHEKISAVMAKVTMDFIKSNQVELKRKNTEKSNCLRDELSLELRASKATHPLTRKLLGLIQEKRTNLCVAIDVTHSSDLIRLADLVGPHICILKTHIDILEDFELEVTLNLKKISEKHKFLIMEDRKFSDIGNTVRQQYGGSLFRILSWADLVTVHGLPGGGVIEGLKRDVNKSQRGCFIVAEMSSEGALCTENYVKGCLELAKNHSDFVIGFVSQSNVSSDANHVLLTPGVNLEAAGDSLGQKYRTPETVIAGGMDIIIVGRGITESKDPKASCIAYQERAFAALQKRLK